jgi:hypothetical protein
MEFFVTIAVLGAILWMISQSNLKTRQPTQVFGNFRGRLK